LYENEEFPSTPISLLAQAKPHPSAAVICGNDMPEPDKRDKYTDGRGKASQRDCVMEDLS
jgi:hypothetical protein